MSYNDDYADLLQRYELLRKEREEWTFKRSVFNEFYKDVVAMRKLQQGYFASRAQSDLSRCKVAERRVDEGIGRLRELAAARPKQQEFDFAGGGL